MVRILLSYIHNRLFTISAYMRLNINNKSDIQKALTKSNVMFFIVWGTLSLIFFSIDLLFHFDFVGGYLYIFIVALSLRSKNIILTLFLTLFCSILTIIGHFYAAQSDELWVMIANRFTALVILWIIALLIIKLINKSSVTHEKTESETKLKLLINSAPYCIHQIDTNGKLMSMNPAGLSMMGVSAEEQIIGSIYMNAVSDDDKNRIERLLHDSLNGKASEFEFTASNKHIFSSMFIPIFDDKGNVLRLMGMTQDITERKHNEDQLKISLKMDALGKLTGGIAHDFNNILGIIFGYSELLQSALKEQPKLAKYASEINRAGERGAKLTKKLLGFSQKRALESTSVNLNLLLKSEQDLLEKTLTVRINLLFDLEDDLWTVKVNDSEMADVILNICINAMHAIDGNGELRIYTSNAYLDNDSAIAITLTPGDYVLLTFTDTGCGMDENTQAKIFEPFYTTKGQLGAGLGLSQVYNFVHVNRGSIKVKSKPRDGTQIVLYIPRFLGGGNDIKLTEKGDILDLRGTEAILLVDDETALLTLNHNILTEYGFNVTSVDSAKKALDILETETFDLLISDVIMPYMNGYQLAEIVKDKYSNTKIQLVSGYAEVINNDTVDECLKKNILLKPFSSQSLLEKTRAILNT